VVRRTGAPCAAPFTAAARSVLIAGADPETGERSIVHIKSSLAPAGASIGYELREGSGLVWLGASEATAATLLAPERTAEPEERGSALADAETWLSGILEDGSRPQRFAVAPVETGLAGGPWRARRLA